MNEILKSWLSPARKLCYVAWFATVEQNAVIHVDDALRNSAYSEMDVCVQYIHKHTCIYLQSPLECQHTIQNIMQSHGREMTAYFQTVLCLFSFVPEINYFPFMKDCGFSLSHGGAVGQRRSDKACVVATRDLAS